MGDLLGYARVSTLDQDTSFQEDALREAGCVRVFTDVASGAHDHRPELARLFEQLRHGDTLVVWRLDRLGRSLPHLIATVQDLKDRAVGFRSLQESIDTTTSGGRLIFHVFGALAEFERELVRERTHAGLAAARASGRTGGRPPTLTEEHVALARQMKSDGYQVTAIARALGVSRATIYRNLNTSTEPAGS